MTLDDASTVTGRLVVCEQQPHWAIAWRRFAGKDRRVYEARSLILAEDALRLHPASFLAVHVTPENWRQAAKAIARWQREFPLCRLAAVGPRELAACESVLREAGAVGVCFSPRELAPLIRMSEQHLASRRDTRASLEEEIMAGLPWPEATKTNLKESNE